LLVVPSPKLQDQDVGLPVDVSVNWTDCPTEGRAGAKENADVSTDMETTVTVRLACLDPTLPEETRLTKKTPVLPNAWDGFFVLLVAPSPKSQCHDVGFPELVSANCTVCPGPGVVGLKTNDAAASAGRTVTDFDALRIAVPFPIVRVTRRNPEEAKI